MKISPVIRYNNCKKTPVFGKKTRIYRGSYKTPSDEHQKSINKMYTFIIPLLFLGIFCLTKAIKGKIDSDPILRNYFNS